MRPEVAEKFRTWPADVRRQLESIRRMILEVAAASPGIGDVEETLKWGEPSYLVRGGSTIRLGWKDSRPEYYAVYFNCNTKLVDTFKEIYAGSLAFEGNRAIAFHRDDDVPTAALRHCIELALEYHKLKHLPLLGA